MSFPKSDTPPVGLSSLDGAICLYLSLPLLVFCTWFKWPVALGLAVLTGFGMFSALQGIQWRRVELTPRTLAVVGLVALAWTALAGIGHFFYANLDWVTRDAVLRDLTKTAWPPQYGVDAGMSVILRAPVGYYLPVAALGSVLGLHAADILLYLWSALGLELVLCASMTLFPAGRERLICAVVMLGFGGLDLVGLYLTRGVLPRIGDHIEWWAGFAQYSSNSTLMFWVPNHALPAWLGLVLALRLWRQVGLARITLMLGAAISLWSPLSAAGLVPFFLIALNWRRDLGVLLSVRGGLPFLALAGLVGRYVTMDTRAISRGWTLDLFPSAGIFWETYLAFCMVEFGLLALVLLRLRAFDLKLGVAVLILTLLPFYHFGPGNDLVMRCSIPALMVLALASVKPLAGSPRPFARAGLALVLGVGALGAAQEPERALLAPRWALTGKTLTQVSVEQSLKSLPPNYVGRLTQPGLRALLREPSPVMSDTAASSSAQRR